MDADITNATFALAIYTHVLKDGKRTTQNESTDPNNNSSFKASNVTSPLQHFISTLTGSNFLSPSMRKQVWYAKTCDPKGLHQHLDHPDFQHICEISKVSRVKLILVQLNSVLAL